MNAEHAAHDHTRASSTRRTRLLLSEAGPLIAHKEEATRADVGVNVSAPPTPPD